ncbi:MAG: hypothetical protein HQK49_09530 [Oligoflexia bacterium]|nr:hypothetical protein [Oligoflexia bacterium]
MKIKNEKTLPLLLLLSLLAPLCLSTFMISCSITSTVIEYKNPTYRFETPESSGKLGHGTVGLVAGSSSYLQLLEVTDKMILFNNSTTVDEEVKIRRSDSIGLLSQFGLYKRFDLLFKYSYYSLPAIGIKYQFMGDDRNNNGWKGSISFSGWYSDAKQSGVVVGLVKPLFVNYVSNGRKRQKILDSNFSFGKRLTEYCLLYSNLYYYQDSVDASITSQNTNITYTNSGHLKAYGINLGSEFSPFFESSKYFFIRLESGVGRNRWYYGPNILNTFNYGLMLGLEF